VFHISDGGLSVTTIADWEPAADWAGEEPPKCGEDFFNIDLMKKEILLDRSYGNCIFENGGRFSRTWTAIPQGDYYLKIWVNSSYPNCCLRGDIDVAQGRDLTGESCTQRPATALEILHGALDLAGLIPALGAIPDAVNSAIYVVEGDWTNAGFSAAAMIPIFGDAATVIRKGGKIALEVSEDAVKRVGKETIKSGLLEARKAGKTAAKEVDESASAAKSLVSPHPNVLKKADALRREARQIYEQANPGFKARKEVLRKRGIEIEIDHRVPLEYRHLFPGADPNRLSNLRALERPEHRRKVSDLWDAFRNAYRHEDRAPTAAEVLEYATMTDRSLNLPYPLPTLP
jgi:hypothetical protein